MVLDPVHDRSPVAGTEAERLGQRVWNRPDATIIGRPIADQSTRRAMSQGEQDLSREMRARIARHADVIDVGGRDAGHVQARLNRLMRKPGDMLDAAEAFLFDGCDELAVAHDDRRHVAVIGVDTENVHGIERSGYLVNLTSRVASSRTPAGRPRSSSMLMSTSSRYQNPCSTWKMKPSLPSRNPSLMT